MKKVCRTLSTGHVNKTNMKRKLAPFKGTYFGQDFYFTIDTGKDADLREILETKFMEQMYGPAKKSTFWDTVKRLIK